MDFKTPKNEKAPYFVAHFYCNAAFDRAKTFTLNSLILINTDKKPNNFPSKKSFFTIQLTNIKPPTINQQDYSSCSILSSRITMFVPFS